MKQELMRRFALLLLGALLVSGPGCASMTRWNPFADKSSANNDVRQTGFEEVPESAPNPKNPNQLKLAYARWMEEQGQMGEARAQYDAVRKAEPRNVEAVLGLARLEMLSGRMAEAEQGFQRALKLNPNSAVAHYELGRCYEAQHRWGDAAAEYNKAVLADPMQPNYRYQLAIALAQNGEIENALPHFLRVVGDAEAHYNVGYILKEQGRLQEAEKHFALALTKKPSLKQAEVQLRALRGREVDLEGPQPTMAGL